MVATMEKDHSIKTTTSAGAAIEHSSGGKIRSAKHKCKSTLLLTTARYPKHVWSPAGGWYGQPGNWKANTAVVGLVIFGITALAFSVSAERETRTKFPEPGRFYPSR